MNNNRQTKTLYTGAQEGVQVQIQCLVNKTTGKIGVGTAIRRQSNWSGGAATNKTCSCYLGVVIAETLLSQVFKNVTRMPNGNIGFDFICGKGFKIDVKSACLVKNRNGCWQFTINRNPSPHFFLCIAFDNRTDLNPLHVWLIPNHVVNHLLTASITESKLKNWVDYELIDKINPIVTCCDIMKDSHAPNNLATHLIEKETTI